MKQKIKIPVAFSELLTPGRYKAYYGGRGTAKSHSGASAALIRGGEKKLRIGCFREIQLSIKDSVKQLLDDKIAAYGLGGFYESIQNEIRGSNGTNFIFAGLGKMTTDQIKSFEGIDIALVEEAQTISAYSLEVLIPTIRKAGSELWFFWNPRHSSDPVDNLFRGPVIPEDAVIRRVSHKDNPFFPDELKAEMEFDRKHKPNRFAHIWEGEYEPAVIGAIWDREMLHRNRRDTAPDMEKILVAVDHAISDNETSNEHGIIVGGKGSDDRGYVLADLSMKGQPHEWARQAINAYDFYEADGIVIEVNQGGDLVRHTLDTIRPGLPIIEVKASRGKHVRAAPIASMYAMNLISHIGVFPELEAQMCRMTSDGYQSDDPKESPDRCDALVWLMTELFPSIIRRPEIEHELIESRGPNGWLA